MINPNDGEVNLKTFNQAKRYVEEILHPMMLAYQKYARQSDFGDEDLENSTNISEEMREISRYNGLKAMNDVLYNMIHTIKSTVLIHNNKEEVKQMKDIIEILTKIKLIFYEHRERFFITEFKNSTSVETLDRNYFEKIKVIIMSCYANVEILMTRNKLLFADSKDEFTDDEQLMEQIRKEYTEV